MLKPSFSSANVKWPPSRYWERRFDSNLGFSFSSDFDSAAVAGWRAPPCSVRFSNPNISFT
jgi:hypothetical protein